jgi:hypothetical protein
MSTKGIQAKTRPLSDVLKLFACGLLVVFGLMALTWLLDEKLHMSPHWRLFCTANILAFAALFWYLRRVITHLVPAIIIIGWALIRTAIAFQLAKDMSVLLVMITAPIESYFVVIVVKMFAVHKANQG